MEYIKEYVNINNIIGKVDDLQLHHILADHLTWINELSQKRSFDNHVEFNG